MFLSDAIEAFSTPPCTPDPGGDESALHDVDESEPNVPGRRNSDSNPTRTPRGVTFSGGKQRRSSFRPSSSSKGSKDGSRRGGRGGGRDGGEVRARSVSESEASNLLPTAAAQPPSMSPDSSGGCGRDRSGSGKSTTALGSEQQQSSTHAPGVTIANDGHGIDSGSSSCPGGGGFVHNGGGTEGGKERSGSGETAGDRQLSPPPHRSIPLPPRVEAAELCSLETLTRNPAAFIRCNQ